MMFRFIVFLIISLEHDITHIKDMENKQLTGCWGLYKDRSLKGDYKHIKTIISESTNP